MGIVDSKDATKDAVGLLMAGVRSREPEKAAQ